MVGEPLVLGEPEGDLEKVSVELPQALKEPERVPVTLPVELELRHSEGVSDFV